jgi:uncharacterized protein
MIEQFKLLVRQMVLQMIKMYQKTLSLDHGWLAHRHPYGYCRFQPTCSDYTYQAVARYGVIKGGFLGIKRVFRCNPFSKGGFDPVP